MTDRWTTATIARLTNYQLCPRCEVGRLAAGVCTSCRTDLRGEVGVELGEATSEAVAVLERRAAIIERLPVAETTIEKPVAATAPAAPLPSYAPAAPGVPVAPRPSSQLSLQSVLAVAGAGLFAIAAIFFTFLSPELEGQQDLRSLIVAVTTVVFLGGAWLLTRTGLRFSGETVGALGMVFVALDVWSVSRYAQYPLDPWAAAAIATLVAALVMVGIAVLARIRTWLWSGAVGLAFVPAFFGYAADDAWYSTLGHLGSGFAALAVVAVLPALAGRFSSPLTAERIALVVVRLLWLGVIGVQLIVLRPPFGIDAFLATAGVLLALAALAALSTRDSLPRVWSITAGALAVAAGAVAPLAWVRQIDDSWMASVVPVGALGVLLLLAGAVQLVDAERSRLHPTLILHGAWSVTILVSIPAGFLALVYIISDAGLYDTSPASTSALIGVLVPVAAGLVVAAAAGRLGDAGAAMRPVAASTATAFGMYALLMLTSLTALPIEARLAIGIAIALTVGALVWRVAGVATAPLSIRVPLVVGAHVILLHALVQAWSEGVVGTVAQVAIVVGILVLSLTVARVARPVHIGAAMTLGLFVFSGALDEYTVLDSDAILALTATLGLLIALAGTLAAALRTGFWYAILIVAAVPFALAIGWRVVTDTGWIALPAAAAALLGALLLVSQRPGQHALLRALGGAMVVPALATVTVGVVPELASTSGSPIALPIVAGLVAVTLPFTAALGRLLERRGIDPVSARSARLAVEGSALITAGIAVVIALLRVAAGFDTTFLVLAIVGLGGAATALFSGRRYGWVITYATWSGALWSVFALWGVEVLEPYVLPPALAAVIIGGVAVFRGRPGQWMVIVGLVVGALPTLALLAAQRGDHLAEAWRLWGLIGASVVLIALGALFAHVTRLGSLRVPVLAVSILTASAGMIGAIITSFDRLHSSMDAVSYGILPVLGLAALGALLAAVAARLIAPSASRWLYVPALAYLLVGTSFGIRSDVVSIWTLYGLMIVFLIGVVAVTLRTRSGFTALPPVWLWFAFAWIAGVVSWSQRELLRVEGFSVPMAIALLAAGIIAWRSQERTATLNSWPVGFSGSWGLLGPGLFVLFVPSILATFTTPETWRAVFVIVLALVSILLGSRLKLAAPFIGGIAVLPLENIVVFAVQSSRDIQSTPWWITLASAGAVLLVIAVTAERKTTGGGIAARIRDLD